MSIVLQGKHKIVFPERYVQITIAGVTQKLYVYTEDGDSLEVPFSKYINLVSFFGEHMDIYDQFCNSLKGTKDLVERTKKFIGENIEKFTAKDKIVLENIYFINNSLESIINLFSVLKKDRKEWILERGKNEASRIENEKKYFKNYTTQLIAGRLKSGNRCRYGDNCSRVGVVGKSNFTGREYYPCRFSHPSDVSK